VRQDKKDEFHFPLTDWRNWRRVRFWGVPAFVGFRYGDEHRAVAACGFSVQSPKTGHGRGVHDRFEQWALPMADAFSTKVTDVVSTNQTWKAPGTCWFARLKRT